MSKYYINGIQQVGVGVHNVYEAWNWYLKNFHFDLPVFDEEAEAMLMLPYTEGSPKRRHAALVLNPQGGGGLEIWKHTSFESRPPVSPVLAGDLGINYVKIKVKDVEKTYEQFLMKGIIPLTKPVEGLRSGLHFYMSDPYGNVIDVIESNNWYSNKKLHSGGIAGATIGVSDMDKSLEFYQEILGYDKVLIDDDGRQEDIEDLTGVADTYRRVILTHSNKRNGAFSPLLGSSEIELIQSHQRKPNKIYQGRMWGELGYIHLCFDVSGMDQLKDICEQKKHPFTVDSANSFDMGEAAGRFAYIEDPDGTLIEFVETHKIPVMKKLGWYYDLRKRNPQKPLSNFILKAMNLNRVSEVKAKY